MKETGAVTEELRGNGDASVGADAGRPVAH